MRLYTSRSYEKVYKAPLQYCLSLVVSQLCSSALPYPHTSHHHPSYHSHLTPPPPQLSLSPHTATTPAITLISHRHPSYHSSHTTTPVITLTSHRHPSYHSHLAPSPSQLSLSPYTTNPAITLTSHHHHEAITLTSHCHHPSYHSHLTPPPPK